MTKLTNLFFIDLIIETTPMKSMDRKNKIITFVRKIALGLDSQNNWQCPACNKNEVSQNTRTLKNRIHYIN